MKIREKLIILSSLIILAQATACVTGATTYKTNKDYTTAECTCLCQGDDLSAVAIYALGEAASGRCEKQCAANCGRYTNCSERNETGCTNCCQLFCSDASKGYGDTETGSCEESCRGTCKNNGLVLGVVDVIYTVVGVIGGLMLIICGIRMVTAQDPHDRAAAKTSMIYVIIALLIIILAVIIVGIFLKPATVSSI